MTDEKPPPRHPSAPLASEPQPPPVAAVASPHHLASEAAIDVMGRGGTALDGAIAANAVLGVVLPDACGIGGDLFALVHPPGDPRPAALNASGRAGSGTTAARIRATGVDEIPVRSPWTVTVPGCVDGWVRLHRRFGRLPMEVVLQRSIELAAEGFEVSSELADSLARLEPLLAGQESAPPLYPNGRPPSPGDLIRRPALGTVLADIARHGRDAFYTGEVARGVVAATDGNVTAEDLSRDQSDWVEPLGIDVFGLRGWTIPPNSLAYLALAAAWIMEQLNPPPDPETPEFAHAAIEAYRSVAWEADRFVADPATAPMDPAELLSLPRLRSRARSVDLAAAKTWPQPSPSPAGTAYLCTSDGNGMGVSLSQSNFYGIGSGLSAGSTGVFLHNRGAGFTLEEGHVNEYTPGRRPRHTLSPTLWTRDANTALLLGTRGGQYQPQLLVQAAASHLWADDRPATCLWRPRWRVDGWGAQERATVSVESNMPDPVVAGLTERGHDVSPVAAWQVGWGPIAMISIEAAEVTAAADPRVSTAAAMTG